MNEEAMARVGPQRHRKKKCLWSISPPSLSVLLAMLRLCVGVIPFRLYKQTYQ